MIIKRKLKIVRRLDRVDSDRILQVQAHRLGDQRPHQVVAHRVKRLHHLGATTKTKRKDGKKFDI